VVYHGHGARMMLHGTSLATHLMMMIVLLHIVSTDPVVCYVLAESRLSSTLPQ